MNNHMTSQIKKLLLSSLIFFAQTGLIPETWGAIVPKSQIMIEDIDDYQQFLEFQSTRPSMEALFGRRDLESASTNLKRHLELADKYYKD